jgi:dTDP-glucose pyrophosphorylase
MLINIIPMSGKGTRFSDVGYLLPKPLIPVSGKPMIDNVIKSMPEADRWIFIVRDEHITTYGIDAHIKSILPDALIIVDENPVGQASTCMLAMDHVNPSDSLFIAACDNAFLFDKKKYATLVNDETVDAIVWTFTDDDLLEVSPKSWGWIKLENDGVTIDTMSVKVPISDTPRYDHAVVATFFFRRAQDFIDAFLLMKKEEYRINNEYYVDSMPIFLKKLGKKSVIFDVDLYVGWGKPSDLYIYEHNEFMYTVGKLQNEKWKAFFNSL